MVVLSFTNKYKVISHPSPILIPVYTNIYCTLIHIHEKTTYKLKSTIKVCQCYKITIYSHSMYKITLTHRTEHCMITL